jgi:transposase
MLKVETIEQIRRAYYVEEKSIRQIAREQGHSRTTVRQAIEQAEPRGYRLKKPRAAPKLGPYHERIEALLAENERLPRKQRYTWQTIYEQLKAEGYEGSGSNLRQYIAQIRRGRRTPAVYLPLAYDPGEDAQVDWGEAEVVLAGERVVVQLFVMRLCYSRRLFVMAFANQQQESFFWGHVQAFGHFGGVPRRLTYDNLKTAVERVLVGKNRQEQASFIQFRSHYLFESHFCTPGQGHEKGGVEHGVGYARRNFLVPPPVVATYEDLNSYLVNQCLKDDQRQVSGQPQPIYAAWEQERPRFQPLPPHAYPCYKTLEVTLTPYSQVIVDTNRYSVPADQAAKALVVRRYPFTIEIYRPGDVSPLARHPRCFGHGQDIFDPLHYLPLLAHRPGALHHAKPIRQWRAQWPPIYEQLLTHLTEHWPEGQGLREFIRILALHQHHAAELIAQAITDAFVYGCVHLDGIALCLRLRQETQAMPASLDLTDRPALATIGHQPAELSRYDQLLGDPSCP